MNTLDNTPAPQSSSGDIDGLQAETKLEHFDHRIYLLISLLTIGIGVVLIVLYAKTPVNEAVERTIYLVFASALLPSGILWTLQHYFLQIPIEHEHVSVLNRYRDERTALLEALRIEREQLVHRFRTDQQLLELMQDAEKHSLRTISAERGALVKRVLEQSLFDDANKEIIIVGSTLDGLFRQGSWFEEFVRKAAVRGKQLKLMFTHWDYVTHREKQEDRADGDIAQELKHSLVRAVKWNVPLTAI